VEALTAHFTLAEFHSHDGALVPADAVRELRALCRDYLEPLRAKYGPVTVLSGYRSSRRNRAVGGAPASFHRYDLPGRVGVAADVRCARGRPEQWHRFMETLNPGGLAVYSWGIHVDNRVHRARW
jgi:uncharacterized protein YcbK (DUF882 family)